MATDSMNFYEKLSKENLPRSRVELHLHLDGAFRVSTILELAKKRGLSIGADTPEGLRNLICPKRPGTLKSFLAPFEIFLQVFRGDGEGIERAAYELCEDQAKDGVIYFEARFCPHLISNTSSGPQLSLDDPLAFTPKMVTESVLKGLRRGEKDFNIKANLILSCLRFTPDWNKEILQLCQEFKGKGVVGIDIAGDEADDPNHPQEIFDINDKIFQEAKRLGIHRTVHAAEAGNANHIQHALDKMETERVGHGYRVLESEQIYQNLLTSKVHIECCPNSSILTGSVSLYQHKHPIVRFAEDDANFSISKDDPLITKTNLNDEYRLLLNMGLTEAHITRANFNAARASFLPDDEKEALLEHLNKIYGVTK